MLVMSISAPLIVSSFMLYNVLFQNSVIVIDDSSDTEWSPGKKRIKWVGSYYMLLKGMVPVLC